MIKASINDSSVVSTLVRGAVMTAHRLLQEEEATAAVVYIGGQRDDYVDPADIAGDDSTATTSATGHPQIPVLADTATTPDNGGDSDDSSSKGMIVLKVFFVVLAGIAIILGLLLVMYTVTLVINKYYGSVAAVVPALQALDYQGVMARGAGLFGPLQLQERVEILRHVFREKIMYRTNKKGDREEKACASHERVCCICLAEYEDGCALLSGKNCEHKMHYDCSMEWLTKHDHCPYCRKVVVSPTDFRQAAIEVLGEERVNDLGKGGGDCEPVERAVAPTSVVPEGGDAAVVTMEATGAVEPDLEAGTGSAADG